MKKKSTKNYIAFTLTEMTMVLLIMSILAAVTTPIVKHAVSDVVNTSEPTSVEKPWKKLANLSGIFYSSVGNGMVSVGNIPSGSAVNYDYPTLVIQANGGNNAADTAQIGFYNSNADNSPKLAMDRYNNILAGLNTSGEISNFDNVEIGKQVGFTNASGGNVNIGSNIKKYYNNQPQSAGKSIVIGDTLTAYGSYTNTAITIGYQNSIFTDTILLGQNIKPYPSSSTESGSIYIGNMAGFYDTGLYNVSIGFGAGGNFNDAGQTGAIKGVKNTFGTVNIGTYAGANVFYLGSVKPSISIFNDVNIGQYAGLRTDFGETRSNNVAIGYGALGPARLSLSPIERSDKFRQRNVAIGVSAGTMNKVIMNSVFIGYYAGADSSTASNFYGFDNSIAIGSFANANNLNTSIGNIDIGYYAGYKRSGGSDTVAIGNYAGYESAGSNSVYIGQFAGYQAKKDSNIGIGLYACAFSNVNRAFCFGNFTKTLASSKAPKENEMLLYSNYVWDGDIEETASTGEIVLAAKNVYAPGAIKAISSDARSKNKISLAPYGIKDFRKFNIYNFSLKYDKDHLKHIGVIAQEYRKAFPLAILKGGKYLSIQPDWLYYSMINAVKDLDKLVQEFQIKFDEYINNFESIKSRITELENAVAQEKANNADMRKQLDEINAKLNKK